jgi:phage-related protein
MSGVGIGVKFGSYDMQDDGVVVSETDVYSAPPNDIQAVELAGRDGALIVQQRYKSKRFTADGHIQKDTIVELETTLDAFKAAMASKNQAFDIDYAGGVRRFLASAENIIIARKGPTTCGFSVEFLSPDGMGWDIDGIALLSPTSVSASAQTYAVTVGGSYMAEPLLTYTLSSVTGGTNKTVTLSNGGSLRGLSVTRTWSSGDVLEVDSLKKTVYVNDVPTDFLGQFPTWQPGAGTLDYLDDFTTRTASVQMTYTRRYL